MIASPTAFPPCYHTINILTRLANSLTFVRFIPASPPRYQVRRGPFTVEEDAVILIAHEIHNNKWATISKLLPGR